MTSNLTEPEAALLPCPFCGNTAPIQFTLSGAPQVQCRCVAGFHMPRENWQRRATPHAAEAGVRAGDCSPDLAQQIASAANEYMLAQWRFETGFNAEGKETDRHLLQEIRDVERRKLQELLWKYRSPAARHRTAAETVGTGADVFFVAAVSGLLYRDSKAAGDVARVLVNGKSYYPATPPATQSALEQAREALDVALWAECNGEAAAHAEGRPRLLQRIEIYRTALAAINAVLTPAKGGKGIYEH